MRTLGHQSDRVQNNTHWSGRDQLGSQCHGGCHHLKIYAKPVKLVATTSHPSTFVTLDIETTARKTEDKGRTGAADNAAAGAGFDRHGQAVQHQWEPRPVAHLHLPELHL